MVGCKAIVNPVRRALRWLTGADLFADGRPAAGPVWIDGEALDEALSFKEIEDAVQFP